MDVFLSWSMPIYYGCTNITDYFPREPMILIAINKPEEAIEIINKAVADDLWSKNIEAIREARNLVLNKYQTFPMIKALKENELDMTERPKIITYISNENLNCFQIFKKRVKRMLK